MGNAVTRNLVEPPQVGLWGRALGRHGWPRVSRARLGVRVPPPLADDHARSPDERDATHRDPPPLRRDLEHLEDRTADEAASEAKEEIRKQPVPSRSPPR
jgi:hypothetical protein